MRFFFAILAALAGVFLLLGGYRVARIAIPLFGFVAGLSLGASLTADAGNNSFLGTTFGVVLGIILGLVFALFSYLYFGIAVVVLIGSLGYWIGSSFILFLGFSPGLLSAMIGLGLGIVFGLTALAFNAPKYVLIVGTAIAGAIITVGSFLLLINQVPLGAFSYAAAHEAIRHSALWTIVAALLAGAGIYGQAISSSDYELEMWGFHDDMFHHHQPPTTHPTGVH